MSEQKCPRLTELYGVDDKSFKFSQRFGEVAIMKSGDKIKNKLKNCGKHALYLCHAKKHRCRNVAFLKVNNKTCDYLIKIFLNR